MGATDNSPDNNDSIRENPVIHNLDCESLVLFPSTFCMLRKVKDSQQDRVVGYGPYQPVPAHGKWLNPVTEQCFVYRWLIRDLTETFRRTDANWLTSISSTRAAINKKLLQEKIKWYTQLTSSACSAVHWKLGKSNDQNQPNWRKITTIQRGL